MGMAGEKGAKSAIVRAMKRWVLVFLSSLLACTLPRVGPRTVPSDGGGSGGGAGGGDGGLFHPPSCSNGRLDGDETDLDCGGSCAGCPDGARCLSPIDCASAVCVGGSCAAAEGACEGSYAGCAAFVDLTDPGANRTIVFSPGGRIYVPACARVRLGQTLTFEGSFADHPLRPACGPAPFIAPTSQGSVVSFTQQSAIGTFGYYCVTHGSLSGTGMAGAIQVVP